MRQRFVRRHVLPGPSPTLSPEPPRALASALRVRQDTTEDGVVVVRPIGELEAATVTVFRQAVAEIGPDQRVILDLADVPFVDSCGIGAVIGAVRRVRQLGGDINIAGARHPVRRVFDLTGIDRIVEILETLEEAQDRLDGVRAESSARRDPLSI